MQSNPVQTTKDRYDDILRILQEHAAKTRRAIDAARLLKKLEDGEHARVAKEIVDRAELLRLEEILIALRKETPQIWRQHWRKLKGWRRIP
jgi:hypothetical protein